MALLLGSVGAMPSLEVYALIFLTYLDKMRVMEITNY